MGHTQLAHGVVTALNVQGQYTVEMTSGDTDPADASAYRLFAQDGSDVAHASHDDVMAAHARALSDFRTTLLTLGVAGLLLVLGIGWRRGLPLVLILNLLSLYAWTVLNSNRSVEQMLD
jgi:hypothetical protein